MHSRPKVYLPPIDAQARLADLGLNEKDLVQSVQRGQAARASCTANHPPIYHGYRAWAETVCALRDFLRPKGWTRSDAGNLPLTINKSGKICLAVSTCDEATGKEDRVPCTRPRGPRTKSVVTTNAHQYNLFKDTGVRLCPEDLKEINGNMTWILLFHHDVKMNEVRAELSRPIKMNADGEVDGWAERIILKSTPISGDEVRVPTDVPQTPDVVVDVKRKRV